VCGLFLPTPSDFLSSELFPPSFSLSLLVFLKWTTSVPKVGFSFLSRPVPHSSEKEVACWFDPFVEEVPTPRGSLRRTVTPGLHWTFRVQLPWWGPSGILACGDRTFFLTTPPSDWEGSRRRVFFLGCVFLGFLGWLCFVLFLLFCPDATGTLGPPFLFFPFQVSKQMGSPWWRPFFSPPGVTSSKVQTVGKSPG